MQSVSYRQGGALQPLISAIDYAPFGPALRLQYANGSEWTRNLDVDYRIQRIAAPGLEVDFGLDAVGNIIALDQGSQQHTIDYDALYRLQALRAGTSDIEGFSYDATGNRLSYSQPAVTQSYSYPSNSHRLDAINGASRSYTAAGNTSAVNGLSLDYSGFNRLSRVANSGLDLQRAHYNGRGEREHRWTASAPRYFGYDEGGRLLFEGDSNTGALRQLFVWLDDQPVALLPQAGAYAGEVLHVHADHLGSPRVVTRPAAGNATVWRWALEGSAFGQHPADGDVDGDGVALEFNLRYPGQYFDSATGWHYNYFRDYEPATGRYVQSDPIGLGGGVNTYSYVSGNPIIGLDPTGLVTCFYSVATHELRCYADPDPNFVGPPAPGPSVSLGGDGVFSGVGGCRNNPSSDCAESSHIGPIPPGEYFMNPDDRPDRENHWRLEPNPPVSAFEYYTGQRRNGFKLHPGTFSMGCITVDPSDEDLMNNYNELDYLLRRDLQRGRGNYLYVAP